MGKYRALARNTVIISAGTLLSKLVTFFMVRLYTGVLTPAEYGTGDLLITTVSLLMPFVSFGISDGVFRFLPEYPRAKRAFSASESIRLRQARQCWRRFCRFCGWSRVFRAIL